MLRRAIGILCLLALPHCGSFDQTAPAITDGAVPVAPPPSEPPPPPPPPPPSAAEQLQSIIDHYLSGRRAPTSGSADLSRTSRDAVELANAALNELSAVDRSALDGRQRLRAVLFERMVREQLQELKLPLHFLPQIDQEPYRFVLRAASGRFATTSDYDDFLDRAATFDLWVGGAIDSLSEGVHAGVVFPRVVVERVVRQLEPHAKSEDRPSAFLAPVSRFPAEVAPEDRLRLTRAFEEAVATRITPAFRKLHDYLKNDYLPHARTTIGLLDVPRGTEAYEFLLQHHTTTSMSPAAIHELGLAEVGRIERQLDDISRSLRSLRKGLVHSSENTEPVPSARRDTPAEEERRLGRLREFYAMLAHASLQFESKDELLDAYAGALRRATAGAAQAFEDVPPAPELRSVEVPSGPPSWYERTAADPGGILMVNTWDAMHQRKYVVESAVIHEAIPGHHLQMAAGERPLPAFPPPQAFVEGWAGYVETLGPELGMYDDIYQETGRLLGELWRAMRLVIDTGIHGRGWTRDDAVRWAKRHSPQPNVNAEVDRIIARPGWAVAAKVGQITISEMRRREEERLGAAFDVRAFHHRVLQNGALPLDLLEEQVRSGH